MNIRCMIVDDEPLAREILRLHLSRLEGWQILKECKSAMEAYEFLVHEKVDLIFLDIQMPRVLGTDFLRSLKDPPKVIFTTAYSEYAVQGFDLNAIDYLLKPITFDRLAQAALKAETALGREPAKAVITKDPGTNTTAADHLFIKQENKQVKVMFGDILFLEARRDFTMIQLRDKKLLAGFHLKLLEEMLPSNEFMRVHRSYIVRLKSVDAVFGNTLELQGFQIPISAAHKDAVATALNL